MWHWMRIIKISLTLTNSDELNAEDFDECVFIFSIEAVMHLLWATKLKITVSRRSPRHAAAAPIHQTETHIITIRQRTPVTSKNADV